MLMLIIILAAAVTLLWGVKVAPSNKWHEDFLSLDVSKGLLGFSAVSIIMHHLSQALAENAGALIIYENVGVCFVGLFFFFSGYGLLKSKKSKPNYMKGFLLKRYPSILVPSFFCTVIFFTLTLIMGWRYSILDIILTFAGWYPANPHMWYMIEIAILYLIFFLVYRFIKKPLTALIVMAVIVIALIMGSFFLGHGGYWFQGEWWYNATLLFVIGIAFAQYEEKIVSWMKSIYYIITPIVGVLLVLFVGATLYALNRYSYWSETPTDQRFGDKAICLSVQLPMIILFVFFVLLLTMKIQFRNKALDFLGKISLEIYLIHNIFIFLFNIAFPGYIVARNAFLYAVCVIVCAILLAIPYHYLNHFVIGLLTGKKKKKLDKAK